MIGITNAMWVMKSDAFKALPDLSIPPVSAAKIYGLSSGGGYALYGIQSSPYFHVYKRNDSLYTKLPNPTTLPASPIASGAISDDGTIVAVVHAASGVHYVSVYLRTGDSLAEISKIAATGNSKIILHCALSGDGNYLALGQISNPMLRTFKRNGNTYTEMTQPNVSFSESFSKCTLSYDGTDLATVSNDWYDTALIQYKRNASDQYLATTDPNPMPDQYGYDCKISGDGKTLGVCSGLSGAPGLFLYKRASVSDIFTGIANPVGLLNQIMSISISYDGNTVLLYDGIYPYVTMFKFAGGEYKKFKGLSPMPSGVISTAELAPSGDYLGIGLNQAPFVKFYKRG